LENHALWHKSHSQENQNRCNLSRYRILRISFLRFEQTIREAVDCSGIGLHSGVPVRMRILPGSPGGGIVFRRTDLDGFAVEATGRNVAKVSYATSLMKKGVLISTTEHLLSAFVGMGVDNAIVELDNLELPILDGSALPIVEMVQRVGLRQQKRLRQYLRVLKPVEVREGNKFIGLYPSESFSVSYTINFPHPLIGEESIRVDLSRGEYASDIAPARTFGFLHEAEALRNMGLIRGASEENAVVLTRDGILNGPLRFADEFVRHKVLDLIGDLSLIGHQVLGRVEALLAGHAMHTALVRRLLRDTSSWELATLGEVATVAEAAGV
jgi:UDP-3-O-[3-hydroxymyristoyl] N-acetylglucosamine deacetylase